jgi:anti-sigma regulatory factor (Ser/Thr protein kinase)
MTNIYLSNIDQFLYFFKNRNNDFNGMGWVEPIFIAMTRAYQAHEQLTLYVDNDYCRKMLLDSYQDDKTYSPVERIYNRIDVERIANHITSIMLQNYEQHLNTNDLKDLRNYLQYLFSELMNNVADHSHSSVGGFAMAQYYFKKKKVQFAVADKGVGFLSNIKLSFPEINTEKEAILKALEKGVTSTRARMYQQEKNSGYGLYAMFEILKLTSGIFVIISNNTMAIFNGKHIRFKDLDVVWNGTVIAFEFFEENINYDMEYFQKTYLWNDLEEEEDFF